MSDERDPFAHIQADAKAHRDAEVPDVIPPTIEERLCKALEQHFGLLLSAPVTGATIRRQCHFCHGRGCLNCDTLANAEYKRQFPDGPKVLASFDLTTPAGRDAARAFLQELMEETP